MFEQFHKEVILKYFLHICYMVVVISLTLIIAGIARKLINGFFSRSSKFIKTDPTNFKFLKHFISGMIYFLGLGIAMYTIPSLRTISVSLFTGAGIFAAIIGLASQTAFSNIVQGIFIVIFKPFRVGDKLELKNDINGVVEDINLRHTVVRSNENKMIFIPNSIMGQEIIVNANINDETICKIIDIHIDLSGNIDKAMKIFEEEAMKHPDCLDRRTEEEKKTNNSKVLVKLIGFGDNSSILRAFVWAKDPTVAFNLHCDLNKIIKERFDSEGIEFASSKTIVIRANE
jgi:small conductance mechanosensitive channel